MTQVRNRYHYIESDENWSTIHHQDSVIIQRGLLCVNKDSKQNRTWRQVHPCSLVQHQASHIVLTSRAVLALIPWIYPSSSAVILFEGWHFSAARSACWQVSLVMWFVGAGLTWSSWSVCAPLALGWSLSILAEVAVCAGGASSIICITLHVSTRWLC